MSRRFTLATALGRVVRRDEDGECWRDFMIKMLYDATCGASLPLASLRNVNGLDIEEVKRIIAALQDEGLVTVTGDPPGVALTMAGGVYIETLPGFDEEA
jgi:hypothetical protein